MPLKIFLSSTLRKYFPGYDSRAGIDYPMEGEISVAALIRKLKLPQERVKIVMVNGAHASFDDGLKGDERVALFPPVGGG
ncbi:MAG: MoaD/ThiS family protein [Deltaproteobacteria bacterium]|nr:MoaD/ThiS family protein [Deltaproteobacteria bacterium]